jgi:hypothetical protein
MWIVAALVFAALIGGMAYNFGFSQGIEESGKVIAAPGGAPYPYMGWHRPWGFPFFFAPLFFIFFWIVVARAFFGRHGGFHRGCSGGLDEWHRRAHERMWNDPSGEGSIREGTTRA